MNWRFILYAFLIYLLYRLIFNFIIPVFKTTKQVKKQFREMHSRMEEQMNQSSFTKAADDKQADEIKKTSSKEQGGDYIDYEEVK